MLCDVVRRRRRRRRRRWAHAPVIHAASHFDHKKRVAWVPISMHTCGSFFYNYGAPLGGPSGRRSSAIIKQLLDSVFVISGIIKISVSVISLSLRLRLITLTSTLIIPDITKTSSNNCLLITKTPP